MMRMSPSFTSTGALSIISGVDDGPILHVLGDVDNRARTNEEIQRIRGHVTHAVGAVHRAIDVGADVKRQIDPLRNDVNSL